MSKIMPIVGSQSFSQEFDRDRSNRRYKENDNERENSPAVINHVITKQERLRMKQLALPFDEDLDEVKVFELYMYSNPLGLRYRTYGKHIDYTLAKSMNDAEELFSKSYPNWWATMGVKEVSIIEVENNMKKLEQQIETCKFVLQALNII